MTTMLPLLVLLLPFLLVNSAPVNNDAAVREYAEVLTLVGTSYWTVTIGIGNPPQPFNVVIDTTTASLWVGGPNCTSAACKRRATFQPTNSITFIDTPIVVNNSDHNGKEVGMVVSDSVMLGSLKNKSITVPGNNFAMLNDIPFAYQVDGVDGVLGLGYTYIAIPHTLPPFSEAAYDSLTTNGIFTIWLEDQYQTSDQGGHGVIYFGNADPLHCPPSPKITIPQTTNKYFQFTTSGLALNNSTISSQSSQTTIDSTSPYIAVPNTAFNNIMRSLNLNQNGPIPAFISCDTKLTLTFTFSFGMKYDVTELNLIYKLNDGRCVLNLVASTTQPITTILGTPFLRGRCSFFDVINQTLGFSDALSH